MPNWVMNVVRFDCNDERMNEIKKAITDDEGNIEFNKIIPMPESLNLTSGSITDRSLNCYRNQDQREALMKKYNISNDTFDAYIELGKIYDLNIREYGFPTWYEWCFANWGTKWNASKTYWNSSNIVTFETAWSCPIPIYEKLSEMYPDIPFEVAFADEDIVNNCGLLLYTHGEGVEISPFREEEEAIEFAESIWDGKFEFEGE